MTKIPKWLTKVQEPETTRTRSGKQETKLAKILKGKVAINSGATFGQNDILADYCEVEAKTTKSGSYRLNMEEWSKIHKKCDTSKIPIQVIQFESFGKSLAVLALDDLEMLINTANNSIKKD